jgi:hypothetical protein
MAVSTESQNEAGLSSAGLIVSHAVAPAPASIRRRTQLATVVVFPHPGPAVTIVNGLAQAVSRIRSTHGRATSTGSDGGTEARAPTRTCPRGSTAAPVNGRSGAAAEDSTRGFGTHAA